MRKIAPDEQPLLDRLSLTKRIHSHTHNPGIGLHDVRWTSVFRPNIRLAQRYRVGRVFLAGDAAHVHTPAGGQGLNTGIQDAYNLGWKLAQVLAGADDRLLDTYEAERLPIATAVLGLSTKKYAGLSTFDPSSIRRGKDEQQLAITYLGGPLAPSEGERTKTLRVGDRAPDAELISARGERVRLFSLFAGRSSPRLRMERAPHRQPRHAGHARRGANHDAELDMSARSATFAASMSICYLHGYAPVIAIVSAERSAAPTVRDS